MSKYSNVILTISLCLATTFAISGCRNPEIGLNYEHYMKKKNYPLYNGGEAFEICHGYGCRLRSTALFSPQDMEDIRKSFGGPYKDAATERAAMAKTIGVMETIIGAQTGTSADIAGTYTRLGNMQLDCVDESINTTNSLRLLDKQGLLKHNKVRKPISRTFLSSGRLGPHQTATIMETATTDIYAIDSWFWDNGVAATVVAIDPWRNGFSANPDVQ